MKKLKLFLVLATLVVASSASAQFVNVFEEPLLSTLDGGWRIAYISIDSPSLVYAYEDGNEYDDFDGGFTVGCSITKPIHNEDPLFLEYGAELSYAYISEEWSDSYYLYNRSQSYITAMIPINVIYKYNINDNVSLAPFVGIGLKIGVSFTETNKRTDDDGVQETYKGDYFSNEYQESYDRLLLSWQHGLNVHIQNKYMVGVKWQKDINSLYQYEGDEDDEGEKVKGKNSLAITLGMRF